MNGLIPASKARSIAQKLRSPFANSIAGGVCLFFGFIIGTQIPTSAFESKSNKTTIDFSKLSWVADEFGKKPLKLAENSTYFEGDVLNVTLTFSSFELPTKKVSKKNIRLKKLTKKKSNLTLLAKAFIQKEELKKESIEDVKLDFQMAMESLRSKFLASVDFPKIEAPKTNINRIEVADYDGELDAPYSVERDIVVRKPSKRIAVKANKVRRTPGLKTNIYKAAPTVEEQVAEVTDVKFPEPEPVVVAPISVQVSKPTTMSTHQDLSIQTTQASAEIESESKQAPQAIQAPVVPSNNGTQNSGLSPEEAENIKSALLNEQLKRNIRPQNPKPLDNTQTLAQKSQRKTSEPEPTPEPPVPINPGDCDVLANHKFIKPGSDPNIQICPERKDWISKDSVGVTASTGWVKLESENSFPVITRHPAANGGPTLLLEPNSVALIAIKAGVRVAKGAGILVGLIPDGFKVEFLGRGEEAETFELAGKKYFAFLNAEPGAGVIEVTSEKDQNISSTVFAPVVQDTITYLDLAKPELKNIFVQVIKSGKTPDPEIAGLTVGLSTYRGIQAITQTTGHAALRNVNVVPGFPVFVDVSSKNGTEQGFTYRYELKYKNASGVYLLNQVTDQNIYKWVRQVPRGISDQSAMILGSINPRLLNGFKSYYYPRIHSLSEKFGLEPMGFSILWNGLISSSEPIEGDKPRFMAVQVPEGIAQVKLMNEFNQEIYSNIIPVSPRVINVISE